MLLRTLFFAGIVTLTTSAPVAKDFDSDSMLAVGGPEASSYAAKRKNFEAGASEASSYGSFDADSMLDVGAGAASSYAPKGESFEADSMLAVGANDFTSYA